MVLPQCSSGGDGGAFHSSTAQLLQLGPQRTLMTWRTLGSGDTVGGNEAMGLPHLHVLRLVTRLSHAVEKEGTGLGTARHCPARFSLSPVLCGLPVSEVLRSLFSCLQITLSSLVGIETRLVDASPAAQSVD